MYTRAKCVFIMTESPLHVGSGTELGVVDLPVQRERHTGYPKIEASSLKGPIRAAFERIDGVENNDVNCLFGPPTDAEEHHGSAIGFTDGRILLFPVKSVKGVFAWVTSLGVLERMNRDLKRCGQFIAPLPEEGTVSPECDLLLDDSSIVLEEYTFKVKKDSTCGELAAWLKNRVFTAQSDWWTKKIQKSLVVLQDEAFADLVSFSTEVITRTKIDSETGTVERGGLFTEELIPMDTVFYMMVLGAQIFLNENRFNNDVDKALSFFQGKIPEVIQLGGDETLGRGIVRLIW
ncbi:MAG: type III-B CRISPR module RAMP protein Cmr4 [Candidatus Thorarchaeota archaeon]|nr:type III-B CRISPR module RAMP protein Cmr4 [Candidatus Thorarchaeota archaeon]